MDANFAISYFNKLTKEAYTEDKKEDKKDENKGSMFGNLFSLLVLFAAVYLSWTCNTKCEPSMDSVVKGVRAFFAGMFGWLYLIVYFLFWSTGCNKCVTKPM